VVKVEPGFSGTSLGRMKSMALRRAPMATAVRIPTGPSKNSEASSGLASAAPCSSVATVPRAVTSMAPPESRPY
jgi:hypothetical protein